MSNFVSLFDVLETQGSLTPIKDEILTMKFNLKKEMDKGLTPEEMKLAQEEEKAILAAENILEKL
jgi:hypothetical protein